MTPVEVILCILAAMVGVHFGRKHREEYEPLKVLLVKLIHNRIKIPPPSFKTSPCLIAGAFILSENIYMYTVNVL